eukprot:scaffold106045_cov56-Attheya_sp.AAC.3
MNAVVGTILRLSNKGAAVALVSSEGLRLNAGSFKNIYVIDHRFPRWSIDEFKFACQHRPFFEAVKVCGAFGANGAYEDHEQLLDEKFFVAGHSARYMFTELIADVTTKIAGDIAAFQPTLKVVSNALVSAKCFGAVNTLISCLDACNGSTPAIPSPLLHVGEQWPAVDPLPEYQGKRTGYGINNCFVSVLAAQKIVLSMQSPSWELRRMGLRMKEPSVVGYAFQQRFLEFANQHLTLQTPARAVINDVIEDWEIGIMSESSPLERLQQAEDALPVTAGAEHSFNVYAVDRLLRTLEGRGIILTHVDFVVVRPLSNDDHAFTLENPAGSLDKWLNFSGEQWARGGNARNQVRCARVPWE